MKKIIIGVVLLVTAVVGWANVASAHTAEANPSCSSLYVKAFIYPSDVRVTIVIDGDTKRDALGGGEWNYEWSQNEDHTWSAVIDSPDGDGGTQYDRNFGGTWKACQRSTTSTSSTSTTSTVPETTTTVPESTSTTSSVVTTSTAPATTTSSPPSTVNPSTSAPTTTAPGMLIPPAASPPAPPAEAPPVNVIPPSAAPGLPATGADLTLMWRMVFFAMVCVCAGLALRGFAMKARRS